MSTSTLEDRIRDAEHDDLEVIERGAREEIKEAFALMRNGRAHHVAVPMTAHITGRGIRETSTTLATAVADMLSEGRCDAELLAALQHSDCPHVEALRKALCATWQNAWARDIAEARL